MMTCSLLEAFVSGDVSAPQPAVSPTRPTDRPDSALKTPFSMGALMQHEKLGGLSSLKLLEF